MNEAELRERGYRPLAEHAERLSIPKSTVSSAANRGHFVTARQADHGKGKRWALDDVVDRWNEQRRTGRRTQTVVEVETEVIEPEVILNDPIPKDSLPVFKHTTHYFDDNPVRVGQIPNHVIPYVLIQDVCNVLEITNTGDVVAKLRKRGYPVVAVTIDIFDGDCSDDRSNVAAATTQGGAYDVIVRSSKPNALAFAHWVMDDVLVSVLTKGHYVLPGTNEMPSLRELHSLVLSTQDALHVVGENDRLLGEMIGNQGRLLAGITQKTSQIQSDAQRDRVEIQDIKRQLASIHDKLDLPKQRYDAILAKSTPESLRAAVNRYVSGYVEDHLKQYPTMIRLRTEVSMLSTRCKRYIALNRRITKLRRRCYSQVWRRIFEMFRKHPAGGVDVVYLRDDYVSRMRVKRTILSFVPDEQLHVVVECTLDRFTDGEIRYSPLWLTRDPLARAYMDYRYR